MADSMSQKRRKAIQGATMTIEEKRARECAGKLEPHGVHSWMEFATPIIAAALRAHTAELQSDIELFEAMKSGVEIRIADLESKLAAAELRATGELQRALKFEQLRDEAIRKLLAAEADNYSILARVKELVGVLYALGYSVAGDELVSRSTGRKFALKDYAPPAPSE